jgi:hypothetical protein
MKNQGKTAFIACSAFIFAAIGPLAFSQELPRPTLDNSVLVSIEHPVTDSTEVDYIKNDFPWGLYAWPSFSHTTIPVSLSWTQALSDTDAGIQAFKTKVNSLIAAAKAKQVKIHIVLTSGLARNVYIYRDAKTEDVRNAQWYNDNKLASDTQILNANAMDLTIFGTLSRYARKLRGNLYAKSVAVLTFLRQAMDANPDVIAAVSGWGEAELNWYRINQATSLQAYFCDFSPFAVMEFRDWIQHTGLYDDSTGAYRGQGFPGGGAKYQGSSGLAAFNAAFGTSFTTWNLKYYNWSLGDDYDQVPQDGVNNDPHRIPYSSYVHGGMMPTSGSNYAAGGFDPPRTMQPKAAYWELWRFFRETMVQNFVRDLAQWASAAGIPANRWYSHQVPADYLFATRPSDYDNNQNNARYYTSASPLWTADVSPYGSAGATIYDMKFPPEVNPAVFVRTTYWILPDIQALSSNWAIMEYDCETYPQGLTVEQSAPDVILEQYHRIYSNRVHLINFWRWVDPDGEHQIKGMNKETALRSFIRDIRDKARSTNLSVVYTPPKLAGLSAAYVASPTAGLNVQWSERIWSDLSWKWTDWGDFHHFEVFRGSTSDFAADTAHRIGTATGLSFLDTGAQPAVVYYYRVKAFNKSGVAGPASDALAASISSSEVASLALNKKSLYFGAVAASYGTSGQKVLIMNVGPQATVLHWSASANQPWIDLSQTSGVGNGVLTVGVTPSSLTEGVYTGRVTVQDPHALSSPQFLDVTLSVLSSASDRPPYGAVDSPVSGSTGSGSVCVTGWALDDVEVRRVEIRRDADPTDNPAAVGPDGLVYIGDAVFVAGARPDVEASHPGVPLNDRGGWGLMVLTNFLPNRGNGTYRLHAFAQDFMGHFVEIGQTTFTADNATRTKPFGTIDTPAQGGVASGNPYVNFGWALTALPHAIPTDGSTISVYVDGVAVGHPVYNNYREDVASAFPGLANSNGAVGYYYLDTTAYENGVHMIAWTVIDDNGDADGIGSRFFSVENAGMSASTNAAVAAAAVESGEIIRPVKGITGVHIRKGFQEDAAPEFHTSGEDGWIEVEMAPLDRVVLIFDPEAAGVEGDASGRPSTALLGRPRGGFPKEPSGAQYLGYQLVGEEVRALPPGSTLDVSNGVFYWQLGPGFLGEFDLVFVVHSGRIGLQKSLVRVRIKVE